MAYITPEEMERRLQIASQRGATPEQIARTRAKYAGSVRKKDPFLIGVGKAIAKPVIDVGRDAIGGAITAGAGAGEIYQRTVFDRSNRDKSLDRLVQKGLDIMTPRGRAAATSSVASDPFALKPLTVGAQRGATTASYLVPAGRTLKSAVGSGVVSGMAQGAGMDAENLEQFGGQVFAGGVGGGIGGGVMYGAGRVLTGVREGLRNRAMSGAKAPSVRITGKTVDTKPWFVSNRNQQQAIADEIGLSTVQTPDEHIEAIRRGFEDYQGRINSYLQNADPIPEDEVLDSFITRVTDTEFDDATPSQKLFLNRLLKRISDTNGDAVELNNLKSALRDELGNTFSSPTMAPKNQAKRALYDAIKDALDGVSTDIRILNNKQHTLFDLADELGVNAKFNPNIKPKLPLLGTEVPIPVSQGTWSTVGPRAKMGAQRLIPNVSETGVGSVLRGRAGQVAGRAVGSTLGVGGDTTEFVPETPVEVGTTTPRGYEDTPIMPIQASRLAKQGVDLSSLWVVHPDGKRIWNPNTQNWMEYDVKAFGGVGGGSMTDAQRAQNDVSALVAQAEQDLAGDVNTGMILGPLESAKAKLGIADPETYEFNTRLSAIKAGIAKMRAGTSFTPNEERLLDRYTPSVGDSRQELETKLRVLKAMFPSLGGL